VRRIAGVLSNLFWLTGGADSAGAGCGYNLAFQAGERNVLLSEFFQAPQKGRRTETDLAEDELIIALD